MQKRAARKRATAARKRAGAFFALARLSRAVPAALALAALALAPRPAAAQKKAARGAGLVQDPQPAGCEGDGDCDAGEYCRALTPCLALGASAAALPPPDAVCAPYARPGGKCGYSEACGVDGGHFACEAGLECVMDPSPCAGACFGACAAPGDSEGASAAAVSDGAAAADDDLPLLVELGDTEAPELVSAGGACGWMEMPGYLAECAAGLVCNHSRPHGGAEVCAGSCPGTCEAVGATSASAVPSDDAIITPAPEPAPDDGVELQSNTVGPTATAATRREVCRDQCANSDAWLRDDAAYCSVANVSTTPCVARCMGEPIQCKSTCPCVCSGGFPMSQDQAATCASAQEDPCERLLPPSVAGEPMRHADCPNWSRALCYTPFAGCRGPAAWRCRAVFYNPTTHVQLSNEQCCGLSSETIGDVNGDGAVDQLDQSALFAFLTLGSDGATSLSKCEALRLDVDGDSKHTVDDLVLLFDIIERSAAGPANNPEPAASSRLNMEEPEGGIP